MGNGNGWERVGDLKLVGGEVRVAVASDVGSFGGRGRVNGTRGVLSSPGVTVTQKLGARSVEAVQTVAATTAEAAAARSPPVYHGQQHTAQGRSSCYDETTNPS